MKIRSLLLTDEVRLLTLTGPGGVGKTRLAIEAGHQVSSAFPQGVVFVDLATIRDPADVLMAIARALGLHNLERHALIKRLQACLEVQELLLILDNVEHILPAAAQLAEFLASTPRIKLLATSREPFHLRWEQVFHVPPLALPDPQHSGLLEDLVQVPSVALFLQRARAINSDFALTEENARVVAELVVHLDGLPLAIELAAARTTLLSPQMILARLGQRLSLLRWRAQDLPERQQTLRSAIAWSYDLLSEDEQALLRRLGVFAGSFSLEAAEAIAESLGGWAVEGLASLVDKSLVQVQGRDQGISRYVLLEGIREYARERLAEEGELEEAGGLHAQHYLDLAEQADPQLRGRNQASWYARLQIEMDNLRMALRWLLDHGDGDRALRLAGALGYFWWTFGYHREGWHWLEEVLSKALDADPAVRARALARAGTLLMYGGDLDRAKVVLEEAVELTQRYALSSIIPLPLGHLGLNAALAGELSHSLQVLQEALRKAEEVRDESQASFTLAALGYRALVAGRYEDAAELFSNSIARFRALGDAASATVVQISLAVAMQQLERLDEAAQILQEALGATVALKNRWSLSHGLEATLVLLGDSVDAEQRARLLGALDTLTQSTGAKYGTLACVSGQDSVNQPVQPGQERLEMARRAGRSLPFPEIVELALDVLRTFAGTLGRQETTARGTVSESPLSPREQDVLGLVAAGLSNKQIAKELIISPGTAKSYVTSLFNKLGVDTRAHAVAVAAQRGLL